MYDFADPSQHGVPDLDGAGRNILRDWALDNFPYYTLPASSKKDKAAAKASQSELDSRDAVVLAALKTKAELKREGPRGLIRLKAGSVDDREVSVKRCNRATALTLSQLILDEEYGVDQDSDESDDEDVEFDDEEELDEDLEDDEDAEDAEDDLEEGSESGEEVIFENDEEPEESEEEEEEEPVVVAAPSKKRKAAPEPAASKKRKVEFNLVPQPLTKTVVPVKASAPKPAPVNGSAPVNGNDKKRRRASDQGAAPTTKKAKVGRR